MARGKKKEKKAQKKRRRDDDDDEYVVDDAAAAASSSSSAAAASQQPRVLRRISGNGEAIGVQVRQLIHNWSEDLEQEQGRKPSVSEMMAHFDRSATFCAKVRAGELAPRARGGNRERTLKVHHLCTLGAKTWCSS